MPTMNVSLPEELKTFVEQHVQANAYGTSSEYVRELIRHDRDRQHLRQLIVDGMNSPMVGPMDADYFASLRQRVKAGRKQAA
jgi:antitoxin ParD1/3/4